jgi:hypothetical protein
MAGKVQTGLSDINQARSFQKGLRRSARPIRRDIFTQALEALTTGGVGARVPQTQRAVASSRAATSRALEDARGDLARTGQLGTPTGSNLLANIGLAGEAAAADIPTAQADIAIARGLQIFPQIQAGATNLSQGLLTTGTARRIDALRRQQEALLSAGRALGSIAGSLVGGGLGGAAGAAAGGSTLQAGTGAQSGFTAQVTPGNTTSALATPTGNVVTGTGSQASGRFDPSVIDLLVRRPASAVRRAF